VKVALISDVHANLPALEAVLRHAVGQGTEEIWNAGDFLGYGPFPDEVVQRLKHERSRNIIGNYDQKVLQVTKKLEEWKKSKPADKWRGFAWAHQNLSKDSRDYLRSLPQELRFTARGRKILIVHASPLSTKEHLGPDTPSSRLKVLAKAAKAEIIVCGHSHIPFVLERDGVYFINPGSVGRPDDGDPRTSYALLRVNSRSIQVTHHRVAYDLDRAVETIRRLGLPESFARMLIRGRSWVDVEGDSAIEDQAASDQPDRDACRKAALTLGRSLHFEESHAKQVTKLALVIFDLLASLHELGPRERLWLEVGALLHDVGLKEGAGGHHRASFRIVRDADLNPLDGEGRLIAALVARYHRKALPGPKDETFASLSAENQRRVRLLAGIVRVADGLDRSQRGVVRSVSCEVSPEAVVIKCAVSGDARAECEAADRKGDLLREAISRSVVIQCSRL
jgi:putative phosphoesterase